MLNPPDVAYVSISRETEAVTLNSTRSAASPVTWVATATAPLILIHRKGPWPLWWGSLPPVTSALVIGLSPEPAESKPLATTGYFIRSPVIHCTRRVDQAVADGRR
jgi:hypothetical protein